MKGDVPDCWSCGNWSLDEKLALSLVSYVVLLKPSGLLILEGMSQWVLYPMLLPMLLVQYAVCMVRPQSLWTLQVWLLLWCSFAQSRCQSVKHVYGLTDTQTTVDHWQIHNMHFKQDDWTERLTLHLSCLERYISRNWQVNVGCAA